MEMKNLLLLLCSLCVSCIIGELALRCFTVFPIHGPRANRVYDEQLGHRMIPSLLKNIAKRLLSDARMKAEAHGVRFSVVFIPSKENVLFDDLVEKGYEISNTHHRAVENERSLVVGYGDRAHAVSSMSTRLRRFSRNRRRAMGGGSTLTWRTIQPIPIHEKRITLSSFAAERLHAPPEQKRINRARNIEKRVVESTPPEWAP